MDKDVSRRELLRAMGAVAVLAACGDGKTAALGQTSALDAQDVTAGDTATVDLGAEATASLDGATFVNPIAALTSNEHHYVTSCCDTPEIDAAQWTITVLDQGAVLGKLDLALLASLPARTREQTLECISAGPHNVAISNAIWTGLPLLEVFAAAQIEVPKGRSAIKFSSADGYTTGLPLADLAKPVWLAWLMNGVPLPPEHGYPARLLTPGRYGMKNPKWITAIEFLDTPHVGFWESKGWSDPAPYLPNTLIHYGEADSRFQAGPAEVKAGKVVVAGSAFAGQDPIASVEVRVNEGAWQLAAIDYAPGPGIWTLWHFDWQATPGKHQVRARCKTASGAHSDDSAGDLTSLDGYAGSMAVTYEVT